YGGDFDDKPSDYEFSGNGIVIADGQEKPAMQEVRYNYEKYSK
ncbi:glycoside hydrolase family 2 TIM barrel-domain containing protein, partial [Enterococcus faecium]